jgi:hypothetical protein
MARPKKELDEKKKMVAVRLSPEWLDRLQNLVWATGRTVQEVLETGAHQQIMAIEKTENSGKPFSSRPVRQKAQ